MNASIIPVFIYSIHFSKKIKKNLRLLHQLIKLLHQEQQLIINLLNNLLNNLQSQLNQNLQASKKLIQKKYWLKNSVEELILITEPLLEI
jgi:hypothetical protein